MVNGSNILSDIIGVEKLNFNNFSALTVLKGSNAFFFQLN